MFNNSIDYGKALKQYEKEGKLPRTMFPKDFVHASLGILAKIPLVYKNSKVSTTNTLKAIKGTTIDGIAGEDFLDAVLFFRRVPASKYMQVGKEPKFGSFTPKLMYAHKLYNDVPYEMWDKEDPYLKTALGYGLDWLLEVHQHIPSSFREEVMGEIAAYREAALINKKEGLPDKVLSASGYAIALWKICRVPSLELVSKELAGNNANFWRMLLQLWIANPSNRIVDIMILDPWDWDVVPGPVDIVYADLLVTKVAVTKANIRDTYDDLPE